MLSDNTEERVSSIFPLDFWTDPEQLPDGTMSTVDMVKWQKIGNPNHCGEGKIKTIMRHEPEIYKALEPYYLAWKKNEDAPVNGTPIENWPVVSRKMADVMKRNGFRSVEEFSKATDSDLQRIGMGAVVLRSKAIEFVRLKSSDVIPSGQIASLKLENEDLKKKLSDLADVVEKLKESRPRGRPPGKKGGEEE